MKRDELRKVAREALEKLIRDVEAGISETLKQYLKAMGRFLSTFKTVHVFDISQTDGKPLPEFARAQGDPGAYLERLKRFVSDRGIKLERHESLRMAEGVSIGGTILLKACLAPAEEFTVLVHELAHEMLHQDPANRPKEKTVREAEAEAVAYVVCEGVGLDVNTASSDYIQLYNGDKKTLMASLERIQRTAAEILEGVTENEGADAPDGPMRVAA